MILAELLQRLLFMIYDASYDSYIQLRYVVAQLPNWFLGLFCKKILLQRKSASPFRSFSVPLRRFCTIFAPFCGASLQFKSSTFRHFDMCVVRPGWAFKAEGRVGSPWASTRGHPTGATGRNGGPHATGFWNSETQMQSGKKIVYRV